VWLVVGLGNPGPKYEGTRHNVGFRVVERLAARWKAPPAKEKFQGLFTRGAFAGEEHVLLEPMTYMNLSGESVRKAMDFFKVPVANVLVVHDEMDLPFGDTRVKVGGGLAGHNGLRSIAQHCTPEFVRIRVGVGRPPGAGADWVLGGFSKAESAELPAVLDAASLAVETSIERGPERAMNLFNIRPKRT
jgi:peptidyl-tRNA hydrolase, PTH1 family